METCDNETKVTIRAAIKDYFKTLPKDEKLIVLKELIYYFNIDEADETIATFEIYDSEEEYNAAYL